MRDDRVAWNDLFADQPKYFAKCPYDYIASFLFRFADREPAATDVCELGFGSGINLWFAARQGFRIAGVDISDEAVRRATALLAADGFDGDLRRSSFTKLPFADAGFDLIFDRCAMSCSSMDEAAASVREARRVLRDGGRFLFNPYSRAMSAAADAPAGTAGREPWLTIAGDAKIVVYDRDEVEATLGDGWKIHEMEHVLQISEHTENRETRAQWRAIVEAV